MPKQLQLTIPSPCHEDWEQMSPKERGRFCGSCQKQVIDFTNMSDRQLAEFFKKPSAGSVCGRFMTDQLDRDIDIPRKRIPWLKYFFQIAIPAFLISCRSRTIGKIEPQEQTSVSNEPAKEYATLGVILSPVDAVSNDTIPVKKIETGQIESLPEVIVTSFHESPACTRTMGDVALIVSPAENLKGRVVNETGAGIAYASVKIIGQQFMVADQEGWFSLEKQRLAKNDSLEISSAGYETKIFPLAVAGLEEIEKVFLLKAKDNMPEVVVTAMGSIRMGGVMGSITCIRENSEPAIRQNELPNENNLSLYPNPSSAGSPIHFSFKKPVSGYYRYQLINLAGQLMHQQQLYLDAEASVYSIDIPRVALGSYFVILTEIKTRKRYSQKLIIQ